MIRLSAILLLICAAAACALPAQAAARMPYGSFLTNPVSDAGEFAQLLRRDKVVAQRFADHYGMNNDAIADYVEKYGRTITVSKSKNYVEYFIDKSGRVRRHHKLLPPGTKILAVRGTPVLDMRCGNPMNKALPQIVEKTAPMIQETPPPAPAPVELPAPEPVEQPAPAPVALPQVLQEPEPAAPPAPEPVVQVLAQAPMEYPAVAPASGANGLAWVLPGLAGLSTLSGGGGGGDGGGDSAPAVPEPTGLLVLGLGGTGFAITCRRRLRCR